MSGCTGSGASLPVGGPPNQAGGVPGQFQSGSNGSALIRFVNGSPDYANVDVCIDNIQFSGGLTLPVAAYGKAAAGGSSSQNTLVAVAGGITHTIAVYPSLGTPTLTNQGAGAECPTAPGPYFGTGAIAYTTLPAAANTRTTVVLGGTAAAKNLGLYVFTDPVFFTSPTTASAYWHNAAPNYTATTPNKGVGFGQCTTTVTPCAAAVGLPGASNVPVGTRSGGPGAPVATINAAVLNNQSAQALLTSVPPGFYDGAGVLAGSPVPVTSVATPALAAGQAPVYELIAFDAPAGGLNLLVIPEQSNGYGF
jgi:hypothetical protein